MRANSVLEAASDEEMSPHALKQKKQDCFHQSILTDFEQTVSMEKINKRPSKMKLPQIKSRIDIAHYFTPAWNKQPNLSEKQLPG